MNSGRFNTIIVDNRYKTTYILKKLAPGTTYEVYIQAYNKHYQSPRSRAESLETLPESKTMVCCFLLFAFYCEGS